MCLLYGLSMDGLIQKRRNSSALAMGLRLFCTKPARLPFFFGSFGRQWQPPHGLFRHTCKSLFLQSAVVLQSFGHPQCASGSFGMHPEGNGGLL